MLYQLSYVGNRLSSLAPALNVRPTSPPSCDELLLAHTRVTPYSSEELRECLGEEAYAASHERGAAIDPGELQELARALNRAAGERPGDDR